MGVAGAAPLNIADVPLFLPGTVPPLNMLVMGRDHRMYYEAYNDASDLNGDGTLDSGYKPGVIDYFGYFDSYRCYTYASGQFSPASATADKTCAGATEWSGDWLNYMTMSRIDALRKVLYGGLRSTDTATDTVLQRAFIPQDAHSWGKEYTSVAVNGYDIQDYTPLGLPTGTGTRRHLFANTTPATGAVVTLHPNPAINGVPLPMFRVLQNQPDLRIWNWVSKERPVAGTLIVTGINASGGEITSAVVPTDYVVRVQVCGAGTFNPLATNCRSYGTNAKPTGLLQDYGESDTMLFGLLTGSYGKPHDGGVLRKAVASLRNEINLNTGQINVLTPPGIINTIDRLRITSFSGAPNYQYGCGWIATSSDAAGACSMWGNPIAEMMFETVRYFAGKTGATSAFATGANNAEETGIGLSLATWNAATNPYANATLSCAKPFQTVISDTSPSYDSDKVPGNAFGGYSSDVTGLNATTLGNLIWNQEIGGSGPYFIGQSGATYDGAPTPKTASSFANIRGLAPEAPAKEGSYNAASVAHFGLTNDINPQANPQNLQTFAVALASPLPKIEIPVNGRTITLVPFAKSVGWPGNTPGINATQGLYQPTNQIVDFYVDTLTPTAGRFRVNFEDVEQGADHDMDAIATYDYSVSGSSVTVTVTSDYAAGGIIQHMGYAISGTTADGTYLVVRDRDTVAGADVDYFLDSPNVAGDLPLSSTLTFNPGAGTAAGILNDPLWYAAKWGGFVDSNNNNLPDVQAEWDANNDGNPDNYFLVTNALTLKDQLKSAFDLVLSRTASASAVATNTTRLDTNTLIYQAQFRSDDWTGKLLAYRLQMNGTLGALQWDAANLIPASNARRIYTRNGLIPGAAGGIEFLWANLGAGQQAALNQRPDGTVDTFGDERVLWVRGDPAQEQDGGGIFRNRSVVLGDIINSDPQFVGALNFGYDALPMGTPGQSTYTAFRRSKVSSLTGAPLQPMMYVGANDGMLHAFDASTGVEHFAYVPSTLIPELNQLSDPAYRHRYFVDGQTAIGDAYINRGGTDQWTTVMVGTTGAGGKTVFALDVTRPHTFAATDVLWEFTDPDLGNTIGQPVVARMADGTWVAVFGNGYNSNNHRAMLFIVRLADGVLLRKIDTGIGSIAASNGLATPSLIADGTRTIRTAYAGDLAGNLWKFDLSDANPANWAIAFTASGLPAPLFKATDATGAPQSITAPVEIGRHPDGGSMIYFGTGKFFEAGDNIVGGTPQVHTFYGVWDKAVPTAITYPFADRAAMLTQQSIVYEGQPAGSNFNLRVTTQNAVNYTTSRGWYLDLQSPTLGAQGERVVSLPILRNNRVIFPTLIPSANPCEFGGSSWIMELDAVNGMRLEQPPLDITEDGHIDANDLVTVTVGGVTITVAPSAIQSRQGIIDTPAVVDSGNGQEIKIASGTSGNVEVVREAGSGERSRGSWRQLR
jgi:type IV pilus assembly protein PilY1